MGSGRPRKRKRRKYEIRKKKSSPRRSRRSRPTRSYTSPSTRPPRTRSRHVPPLFFFLLIHVPRRVSIYIHIYIGVRVVILCGFGSTSARTRLRHVATPSCLFVVCCVEARRASLSIYRICDPRPSTYLPAHPHITHTHSIP